MNKVELNSGEKINEVLSILFQLGFPTAQQNERSALTLLALLKLSPDSKWSQADNPLIGISQMMNSSYAEKGFAARFNGLSAPRGNEPRPSGRGTRQALVFRAFERPFLRLQPLS